MKNNIKRIVKSVIVTGFATACLAACSKKESEILKAERPVKVVGPREKEMINTLKKYLSEITNARLEDIGYNETTKQFSILGVDQVSLEQLTKFYNNKNKK